MTDPIQYDVPLITQDLQECAQASAVQLLNFYGVDTTVEEFKETVPLYISKDGEPLGTSIGHMLTHLMSFGFTATLHIVELEIFDPSWEGKEPKELIKLLKKRRRHIIHHRYDDEALDLIFDGYYQYFKNGGHAKFPVIGERYLHQLLKSGPVYAIVNFNFLNHISKGKYLPDENEYQRNPIEGNTGTHAVIIAGYKAGKFYLVDPDYHFFGGKRWVEADRLIGAMYLAQTDLDAMIITVEKN